MARNNDDVHVLSLGNNFGKAVVTGASIKVEFDSDGHVTLYRNGKILYQDDSINVPALADAQPVISYPDRDLNHTTATEPESTDAESMAPELVAPEPVDPDIGRFFEGQGIYVGIWEPRDRDGVSLGKIFDLYAAPEDIKNKQSNKNN